MSASGLDAVLPLLACPHCAQPLTRPGPGVVGCENGHRFDIARQGYLSLLGRGSRTDTGDSADMVEARMVFLGAGHFRPIADQIAAAVTAGPVLEIGAGTGYYLAAALSRLRRSRQAQFGADRPSLRVLETRPRRLRDGGSGPAVGIALDASRYAARRVAAAHQGIGSIVADAWSTLPVGDGAVSTVLSVFAPRDPAEIARVLAPGGRLVVVTPEPDHLAEIRSAVGLLGVDPGKPGRLDDAFDGLLQPVERVGVRSVMRLTRIDIAALVRMGPAARHVSPEKLQAAVAELGEMTTVTNAVTVSVFAAR